MAPMMIEGSCRILTHGLLGCVYGVLTMAHMMPIIVRVA